MGTDQASGPGEPFVTYSNIVIKGGRTFVAAVGPSLQWPLTFLRFLAAIVVRLAFDTWTNL